HRHDLPVLMMICEYVVAVGGEAGVLLEERPHFIQRRPELPANVVHRDAAANGRERAGAKRPDGYFVGHDSLPGWPTTLATVPDRRARSIQRPDRSVRAERFFSGVIASVSKRPICPDISQMNAAHPPSGFE